MDLTYIYSTAGDWMALLHRASGCLYDIQGQWIGWLDGKDVYNRDGLYVGFLSGDGRILRKRVRQNRHLQSPTDIPCKKIRPPASAPLAPLFAELPWNQVDVFEEEPEIFEYISDLRPDWES